MNMHQLHCKLSGLRVKLQWEKYIFKNIWTHMLLFILLFFYFMSEGNIYKQHVGACIRSIINAKRQGLSH